jgi:hypothetical protein
MRFNQRLKNMKKKECLFKITKFLIYKHLVSFIFILVLLQIAHIFLVNNNYNFSILTFLYIGLWISFLNYFFSVYKKADFFVILRNLGILLLTYLIIAGFCIVST